MATPLANGQPAQTQHLRWKLQSSHEEASNAEVGVVYREYVSAGETYFREGAEGQNYGLRLGLAGRTRWEQARVRYDLENEWSFAERWNYLSVKEATVGFRSGRHSLSLGRELNTWADWETTWQQGAFQPRYMQDRLNPITAGLAGVFWNMRTDSWDFTLGALPVFIPEFGAHFTTENSRFVSKNPWFQPPAEEFVWQDVPGRLDYSVARPSNERILNNPGAITKLEYREGGYLSRLSLAYKPITQLALSFPTEKQFVLNDGMSIQIHPRVIYTRIANLDNVYHRGLWTVSTSVAHDNPVGDDTPSEWARQNFTPAWIYAAQVTRAFGESLEAPRLSFGFLRVDGGDGPDEGRFTDPKQTKFEPRFQYRRAYMMGYSQGLPVGMNYPLQVGTRLIFDDLQEGGVASLTAGLRLDANWRADMRLDFLGLVTERDVRIGDGFLSNYRANDSVMGGVSYVF